MVVVVVVVVVVRTYVRSLDQLGEHTVGSTTQHHEPISRPSLLDWTHAGAYLLTA